MGRKENHNARMFTLLLVFILICTMIWAAYHMFYVEEPQEEVSISVIVENSNSSKWHAFLSGLEHAAKDFKVDLSIVSTNKFDAESDLLDLLSQKAQDGVMGIILQPFRAEGLLNITECMNTDQSFLFVQDDMKREENANKMITLVAPDYQEIARKLFTTIRDDYGNFLPGKQIKILTSNADKYGYQRCAEYLQKKLEAEGAVFMKTEVVNANENQKYINNNRIDIVIALDDESLSAAGKEKKARTNCKSDIYGIGSSETNVYYLDQGVIEGMIVVNDFKMGYRSLEILAEHIRNHVEKEQIIDIGFEMIRHGETHEPSNEALLYPNIQ